MQSCSKRVRSFKESFKSPSGTWDQSRKANRVKGSLGSSNACWRRESRRGDTDESEHAKAPGFRRTKVDREQLNDERGIKPLPVRSQRDGAEQEKVGREGRRKLLYSVLRNGPPKERLETMARREPRTYPVGRGV